MKEKLRKELISNLREREMSGIIEKAQIDDAFCFNLHAFYSFYLAAECAGNVDIFMDGVEKTSEMIIGDQDKSF